MKVQITEKKMAEPVSVESMKPMLAYRVVEGPRETSDGNRIEADHGDILMVFRGMHYLFNASRGKVINNDRGSWRGLKVIRAFEVQSITLIADHEDRPYV